jgi:hypothetical protein
MVMMGEFWIFFLFRFGYTLHGENCRSEIWTGQDLLHSIDNRDYFRCLLLCMLYEAWL